MPRKRKTEVSEPVSQDAFLRSINIVYDAEEPERIAHFRPTAKTVPLLKALFGARERARLFRRGPIWKRKVADRDLRPAGD